MGTLQKILQLKEEQLNALQSQAEQSSAKSEEPFAAAVVAETVPAETVPAEVDTETAPTPAATAAKTEAPVVEPQAAPAQQTPAAPAEKSLIDQVMDNTAALFGVVVLGVGAIAALMYRRRKEAAEEKEVESLLATEEFAADALDTEAALASVSAERNEYTDAAPSIVAAPEAESAAPTTAQTSDPIAEADIYVAYGRYPQAIDLLQNAIRNEPVRSDFHVKLLEVYLETQDKEGFQAQFAQLQSLGDYAAIGRVKELMSAFDGVEGWLDTRDLIQDDDSDHDHEITDEALLSKGSYQSSTVFAEAHDHDDNGLALDLDTHDSIKAEEGLSLDLTDFETGNSGLHLDHDLTLDDELTADDELTVDANQANTLSFDESHLDLPSGEEVLAADLSFDDDLMHDDHAEKALAEEAPEFLADAESLPEFDGGFANDLERSLQDEGIENDPLALDKGIGQLEELGQLDELGELDEFDQALSELDTNADLASLDSEFGDLLDETTSDLALPETDASLELPSEFDAELPDTLDFSSSDELSSISESDDVALDAGIDLNNLGDLSAFESTAESEAVFDAAESSESDDFDFSDSDEVATKLDLARAYIDMGDGDGAKEILDEVMAEGNDEQKGQASELLARIA
jgi:pilus assembly protein FimV